MSISTTQRILQNSFAALHALAKTVESIARSSVLRNNKPISTLSLARIRVQSVRRDGKLASFPTAAGLRGHTLKIHNIKLDVLRFADIDEKYYCPVCVKNGSKKWFHQSGLLDTHLKDVHQFRVPDEIAIAKI
ncbi:hypothetical protein Slin14017_G123110 [Septoria linicola]|nr:hypothetical protein Slin14017_G123110 [Septoria linicola]